MKIKGINLTAAKALRRNEMLATGVNLSTRVAKTDKKKKDARTDRRTWRKQLDY